MVWAGKRVMLEAITRHLSAKGVQAQLVEVPTKGFLGRETKELGIVLTGQEVDNIWLEGLEDEDEECPSHQAPPPIVTALFRVLVERPLTKESSKAVSAESKLVKQHQFLGIFGGEIAGVKWVGGRVSESLNQDMDISRMLLDFPHDLEDLFAFGIKPHGESSVDIARYWIPRVDMPEHLRSKDAKYDFLEEALKLDWCVPLELCNRIAGHVRRTASLF